jgi:hypothetical protein
MILLIDRGIRSSFSPYATLLCWFDTARPTQQKVDSVPYRLTIFAVIGTCHVPFWRLENKLRPSKRKALFGSRLLDLVATLLEVIEHLGREARLYTHPPPLQYAPAWGIAGGLWVLIETAQTHDHLDVSLRLHRATHHTEAHQRLSGARQETRDDGVEGTFAACYSVGMPRLQGKTRPTIL